MEMFSEGRVSELLDHLNLDTFRPSRHRVTLVKALNVTRDTRIEASSAWDLGDISFCCPRNRPVEDYVIRAGIRDTLQRASCSMDKQEFFNKFIRQESGKEYLIPLINVQVQGSTNDINMTIYHLYSFPILNWVKERHSRDVG